LTVKHPKLDRRERSQPDAKDVLEIQLFGGIGLRFLDRDVPLTNRKAKALIGLLALSANHSETREAIVGQLWSDTEEHKARASLRQVARQLREAFDAATFRGFSTGRTDVVLDPATINVDVAQVCASTKVGRPHALLLERMRLSETLMTGYEDTDPAFRAWLLVQRESLRQKLIRDLELRLSEDSETPVEGRLIGEALLRLDPTHEGACQEVMRSYADAGDIAGALRSYKGLWDLLDQDYDMEPSERTQELVAAIKSGSYRPRPGQDRNTSRSVHGTSAPDTRSESAPPARAPAPSGVLPGRGWHPNMVLVVGQFDGEAVRPEQRHIAAGFRYDLMTRLVRFRDHEPRGLRYWRHHLERPIHTRNAQLL
jgi:DNA-binding SARP family transcriptional activator